MYFLYLIYLCLQRVAYTIAFPISFISTNEKVKSFIGERSQAYFDAQLLKLKQKHPQGRVYWLHVSSAGELEQAIPVLRYLYEKHSVLFLVTYFSPSAKPFLKNVPGLLLALSFPIDSISNHLKLMNAVDISHVLLVRYDIWPGLLLACRKKNLSISLLAATKNRAKKSLLTSIGLDTRRYFFKFFKSIFAVSESDALYYQSLSPTASVHFAGDPKWARAKERVETLQQTGIRSKLGAFADLCQFHKNKLGRTCYVFGSPHTEEHEIALKCSQLANKCLILYAPGEMNESNVKRIVEDFKKIGAPVVRLSDLMPLIEKENHVDVMPAVLSEKRLGPTGLSHLATSHTFSSDALANTVIIVDKMGMLAEIYALADVAIVGGGYDGQIHNTLEPAAHPVPVVFGNKLQRAHEAQKLVEANAAKSFDSTMKLFEFLAQCSSLRKAGETELLFVQELASMRLRALELFGQMPNTNKIIADSLI